ncbi:uncharacterized protein K441DRAFT_314998 [Cenococcum geophilum 1.58]|uniref:Uncharacterized protein n=1 Tax=Cenococcum geophilum 1.58 TaxID=794803 RepID=A0ACC8EQ22_9PEZI|nr:hypothetical protein K441DRAFT_314998 [Cenococcum geophilum 1.58]
MCGAGRNAGKHCGSWAMKRSTNRRDVWQKPSMFKDNFLMTFCSGLFCSVYLIHGNEVGSPGRRIAGTSLRWVRCITYPSYHFRCIPGQF